MDISGGVEGAPGVAEAGGHEAAESFGGGVAAELVGIGEEIAFEGGGERVEIADEGGVAGGGEELPGGEEAELFHGSGDIEEAKGKSWALYVFSSANAIRKYSIKELVELGISWIWMGLESPESTYAKLQDPDTLALTKELVELGISW